MKSPKPFIGFGLFYCEAQNIIKALLSIIYVVRETAFAANNINNVASNIISYARETNINARV